MALIVVGILSGSEALKKTKNSLTPDRHESNSVYLRL